MTSYLYIRYAAIFSFFVFLAYLYLRFIKKHELRAEANPYVLSLQDIRVAFYRDKLMTVAALSLLLSPFMRFISLPGYDSTIVSSFATNPYTSLVVVMTSSLMLSFLVKGNDKAGHYCMIMVFLTFLIFNPIYVIGHGIPGFGYLLYLVGVGLLVYQLVSKKYF